MDQIPGTGHQKLKVSLMFEFLQEKCNCIWLIIPFTTHIEKLLEVNISTYQYSIFWSIVKMQMREEERRGRQTDRDRVASAEVGVGRGHPSLWKQREWPGASRWGC